jgi:TolB protein
LFTHETAAGSGFAPCLDSITVVRGPGVGQRRLSRRASRRAVHVQLLPSALAVIHALGSLLVARREVDRALREPVPGIHVQFGEEYRPAFHGHTFLLGLLDHLISPFTANYEGTAIDSLYPTNTDIFRKAKQQGALTGYVHPFGDIDPMKSGPGSKAVPIDAALGTLDALEWSNANLAEMPVWHRWLNNDIALVPVGGEDSINDLHRLRTLGAIRTYVHLTGPLTGAAWLDGVRQGRTFFTTGPLLELKVNGQLPGSRLRLPASGGTVEVTAAVVSPVALSKVVLYHRHGVLREIRLGADKKSAAFRESIQIGESAWIALAAEGPADPRFDAAFALAGTNAVRIYAGEQKIRDRESAEYFIAWLDRLRKEILEWPWWNSDWEKKHVIGQLDEAQAVYRRLAAESPGQPAAVPR